MWSLRLECRCKIRVHTRGLVPEASPCDKSLRLVLATVCLALKISVFFYFENGTLLFESRSSILKKVSCFLSCPSSYPFEAAGILEKLQRDMHLLKISVCFSKLGVCLSLDCFFCFGDMSISTTAGIVIHHREGFQRKTKNKKQALTLMSVRSPL